MKKSAIPFSIQIHLRPRGQPGRGEATTPYHLHGIRAEPASVRPLVRRMAGRMAGA